MPPGAFGFSLGFSSSFLSVPTFGPRNAFSVYSADSAKEMVPSAASAASDAL